MKRKKIDVRDIRRREMEVRIDIRKEDKKWILEEEIGEMRKEMISIGVGRGKIIDDDKVGWIGIGGKGMKKEKREKIIRKIVVVVKEKR